MGVVVVTELGCRAWLVPSITFIRCSILHTSIFTYWMCAIGKKPKLLNSLLSRKWTWLRPTTTTTTTTKGTRKGRASFWKQIWTKLLLLLQMLEVGIKILVGKRSGYISLHKPSFNTTCGENVKISIYDFSC